MLIYKAIKKRREENQPGSESAVNSEKHKEKKLCSHRLGSQSQSSTSPLSSKKSKQTNIHPETGSLEPQQAEALELADLNQQSQIQVSGPCELCKKEKHDARIYRWKLIAGLLLPYFLASVDLTIVAAALPFIASHFNKLDQLNWIVTAFTLTSTAFIPAFGQLSDVFGRHFVLQLAMLLMLIGSVLCAVAPSWGVLLLGRALQGTSASGITNLIQIILADKVSLKDNAKNSTIFQFVAGISYSVGPIIGGYLTNSNWRYCFVLTIPVAFFAHFIIYFLLRNELVQGSHFTKGSRRSSFLPGLATIDIGGTFLFVFSVGLLILGTAWGGVTYPWTHAAVLTPLVIGSILFVFFFVYEYLLEPGRVFGRLLPQQSPMIPSDIIKNRDTIVLAIIEFATGAAMFSVFYFISIYFTLVEGYEAGRSGLQLLYYIPGIGFGAYFAMFTCNVWPAQTFVPLSAGTIIETVGIALLTWATTTRNIPVVSGMMAVAGAGTGMRFMPATLHVAGIWPDKIAPAMSIMRFSLPFGGTLALTIMGSVFNNKMAEIFRHGSGKGGLDLHNTGQSIESIDKLPPDIQNYVRNLAKNAVMWAFISIIPIMAISLVAVFFLGNVWIKSKKAKEEAERKAAEDGKIGEAIVSSEVVQVPFLWALITGTVEVNKYISTPLSKAEKEKQAHAVLEEKNRLRAVKKHKAGVVDPENASP
ncbi:tRNA synthetases class II (D, K and N) family protein [Trichophyton interdigitale]|nr:tRNA synthetases class II (D, K and N) family protein [Trichophyton interdigitale]KAG5217027.1 tRNA synthetases class II (D, K and N) family protein [Trichophyton interdigitale]KAG8205526.1 tRNA synthetases class II (D, K and N) family protein [Trichophyton interdigitale]